MREDIFSNILVFLCIIVCIKSFSKLNMDSIKAFKYSPNKKAYNNFKSIVKIEGKSLSYISERMNVLPTKVEIFEDHKLCYWDLTNLILILKFSLNDICIGLEDPSK